MRASIQPRGGQFSPLPVCAKKARRTQRLTTWYQGREERDEAERGRVWGRRRVGSCRQCRHGGGGRQRGEGWRRNVALRKKKK